MPNINDYPKAMIQAFVALGKEKARIIFPAGLDDAQELADEMMPVLFPMVKEYVEFNYRFCFALYGEILFGALSKLSNNDIYYQLHDKYKNIPHNTMIQALLISIAKLERRFPNLEELRRK